MGLPSYQTSDLTLTLLQSNWATLLNPLLDLPINKGLILENVSLATGTNNINHKLGRKLRGWWLVRVSSSVTVYDAQSNVPNPDVVLRLVSSAPSTVDIYVF